jgi:hypothetical protein
MAETRNMTAVEDTERICKRRCLCLRDEDVKHVLLKCLEMKTRSEKVVYSKSNMNKDRVLESCSFYKCDGQKKVLRTYLNNR